MRRSLVLLLAAGVVAAIAPPAAAHALMRSSEPADGASLPASPDAAIITFTEEPEPELSSIRVLDARGRRVDKGKTQTVTADPLKLRVEVGDLPTGVYTVTWRVVSRVDGHVTSGAFAFGVGSPPGDIVPRGGTAAPAPEPPSPLAVAGRWCLYAGLGLLLGGAWTSVALFRTTPRSLVSLLRAAWPVAAAGLLGFGTAQILASGAGVRTFAGTTLGRELMWRAVALLLAGVALGFVRPGRRSLAALVVTGAAVAAAMVVHVAGGHAGAGGSRALKIAVQSTHMAAFGVWIGGLAALLVGTRGVPDEEKTAAVRRFSSVALFSVAAIVATGVVRALGEFKSWNVLLSSGYGRLVLVKAGLLVPVICLAAANRYRSVPAANRSLASLRRLSAGEIAIGAAILGATAVLTAIAPPSLEPAPRGLSVAGNDAGTTVRGRLTVTPGRPGLNAFRLELADYDSDEPVGARRVGLRFELMGPDPVGVSTLELGRADAGVWSGRGANLSIAGRWRIDALVERGADSVQIPLSLTLRAPPAKVTVDRVPGQPDLYTAELEGGSLQMYLDPGRPGANQIHATFFDTSGAELAVDDIRIVVKGGTSERREVEPQRLTPGHVAGDVDLDRGSWTFEVTGRRDGVSVVARVRIGVDTKEGT